MYHEGMTRSELAQKLNSLFETLDEIKDSMPVELIHPRRHVDAACDSLKLLALELRLALKAQKPSSVP